MLTKINVNPNYNNVNIMFEGRTENFLKRYKKMYADTSINDVIKGTISNPEYYLGEGYEKVCYNIPGLKNYIIRIFKKAFSPEVLNQELTKPKRAAINKIEDIVLSIPNVIDIVKKKNGSSFGVVKHSEHLINDFENDTISRNETLKQLALYEQIKDFPIKSFTNALCKMKTFNTKDGHQFDFLNPNNLLIDFKKQTIDLIDPIPPECNKYIYGITDFRSFHGTDSLYLVMCDSLLHKNHLANLSVDEKTRWINAIHQIIAKCIYAGEELGLNRNIGNIKQLYALMDQHCNTNSYIKRVNAFLKLYSSTINQPQTINKAVDYRLDEKTRVENINRINSIDFNKVMPAFDKILMAKHQISVEYPEIIDAVLNKILEYGNKAESIIPTLENLLDKPIFLDSKKLVYKIFNTISPDNEKFINKICESINNPIENVECKEEIEILKNNITKLSDNNMKLLQTALTKSQNEQKYSPALINILAMSRSCSKQSESQKIFINNMINAYNYIKNSSPPHINDLCEINKIVLENIPHLEKFKGVVRNSETKKEFKHQFGITEDKASTTTRKYIDCKYVETELNKIQKLIEETNFNETNPFEFAADLFFKLINIHPFYDGNGRTIRLFIEKMLLNKGYQLTKWPKNSLYMKLNSKTDFAKILEESSVKL